MTGVCECGCGFEIGSEEFQKFHLSDYYVEVLELEKQRQEKIDYMYESRGKHHEHSSACFCAEVW